MWRFRTERKRCHFTLTQCTAAILLLSLDLSSRSPPLSLRLSACVYVSVRVHVCPCIRARRPTVAMSFLIRIGFGKSWWGMNRITAGALLFFFPCFFFVVFLVPGYNMSPCLRFYSHLYVHFSVYPVFFLKHIHVCLFVFLNLYLYVVSVPIPLCRYT